MPLRDAFATCPACAVALQPYGARLGCDRCGGTLITEAELLALLHEIDPKSARTLAWPGLDQPSSRACPRCEAQMLGARMEGVAVERCVEHGIWFDLGELAKVLAPEADAEAFAREHRLRQGTADHLEIGTLGLVIRGIYRAIRARLKR